MEKFSIQNCNIEANGNGSVWKWGYFTAQKIKFSIEDFFSKSDQICRTADLVIFTDKILNGFLIAYYIIDLSFSKKSLFNKTQRKSKRNKEKL